jgi:hypothetical protein
VNPADPDSCQDLRRYFDEAHRQWLERKRIWDEQVEEVAAQARKLLDEEKPPA